MLDVDIVVLWVDGDDPKWLAEKNRYNLQEINDSNSNNRFRDNGLMRYWFRSIEKNLPWIRKVHFVTWGHLPPFLNLNNSKLHIVKHTDYLPEYVLPTFNANALEMNLFRIKELAEHFIYFNDDMFVLKPLKLASFFSREGLPCQEYGEIPTFFNGSVETWQRLVANDMGIINKYFNKRKSQKGNFTKYYSYKNPVLDNIRSLIFAMMYRSIFAGFINYHAPAPYLKKTFAEIWNREPDLLMKTTEHRFRHDRDVNQWLALWWQLASGNFSPCRMNTATLSADDNAVDEICSIISSRKYEMISINDPETVINYEMVDEKLQRAFDMILPDKSTFEL